jgi:hypothetical protein
MRWKSASIQAMWGRLVGVRGKGGNVALSARGRAGLEPASVTGPIGSRPEPAPSLPSRAIRADFSGFSATIEKRSGPPVQGMHGCAELFRPPSADPGSIVVEVDTC